MVPAKQVVAARERLETVGIDWMNGQAVVPELQIVDHLALQQVADVGAGGDAEAREQLLGDAGSADEAAPFQHQHVSAGAGQVEGGHQAVVPAAHHDHRTRHCRLTHRSAGSIVEEFR